MLGHHFLLTSLRYASVLDPDGNGVDLYAALPTDS